MRPRSGSPAAAGDEPESLNDHRLPIESTVQSSRGRGQVTEPPRELAPVIDLVRRQAVDLDAIEVAVTWQTHTGEIRVDYRRGDWLRIDFAGDAPERAWLLHPDWGAEC